MMMSSLPERRSIGFYATRDEMSEVFPVSFLTVIAINDIDNNAIARNGGVIGGVAELSSLSKSVCVIAVYLQSTLQQEQHTRLPLAPLNGQPKLVNIQQPH